MKGCKYCLGNYPVFNAGNMNNAYINANGIMTVTAAGNVTEFAVQYCPMCGRKFNDEMGKATKNAYPQVGMQVRTHNKNTRAHVGYVRSVTVLEGQIDSFEVKIVGEPTSRQYSMADWNTQIIPTCEACCN